MTAGLVGSLLLPFPTGDGQGKNIARHQPATLAAMEGLFETARGRAAGHRGPAGRGKRKLDNPLLVPRMLSFLTYQRWMAEVKGLDAFPEDQWPDNIPLLYYSYHIMVGLGTIFIAVMAHRGLEAVARPPVRVPPVAVGHHADAALSLHRQHRRVDHGRGGAPALGDLRADAHQPRAPRMNVSAGNALFTLIGFMGVYTVLSILFLFLVSAKSSTGLNRSRRATGRTRIRRAQALGENAMEALWFCLVAVMLAGYVVLDGFDLGAGIVHHSVARNEQERRMVLRLHRPGLGRQRGVAAGGGGHAVLRLSRLCTPRASAASTCR